MATAATPPYWIGPLNFILFQWFFLRLTFCTTPTSGGDVFNRWDFLVGVVPMSGWTYGMTGRQARMRFLGKRRFLVGTSKW